jgi:hypothetical protein
MSMMEGSMKFPDEAHEPLPHLAFAPSEITRPTFYRLLACYPTAAREVYRSKRQAKARSKTSKKSSKRLAPEGGDLENVPITDPTLNKEVDAFCTLDAWRYDEIPTLIRERCAEAQKSRVRSAQNDEAGKEKSSEDEESGAYLEKSELVELMEWKL